MDPGRLGGLAQGDGLGPARQHAGRDRPLPDDQPPRPAADRRPVPGRTRTAGTSRSCRRAQYNSTTGEYQQGGDSGTGTGTGGTQSAAGTGTGEHRRGPLRAAEPALGPLQGAGRRPDGRRRERQRHRLELLGRQRAPTPSPASRCSPTTRTCRPRCRPSGTRWACTAGASPSKCQYDVSGYTFAGMPGVVIGHNQNIAWGMTNSGVDVTDLYLEKLTGNGYLYDGKVKPFTTREETIKVAGGESKKIVVRETNNGPLLSDRDDELVKVGKKATVDSAAPDRGDGYGIALRWTALDPGNSMDAVFAMDKATDWTEFRKAAALFDVPSQNLTYADTEDNIGYHAAGQDPHPRVRATGSLPSPGWDSKYRWTGYIKQAELPYEYNPDARLHRHRQPGRRRQGQVPVHAHHGLGLRHAQPADRRPDRVEDQGRRQDLHRRHAPDAARQQQRDRQAAGAQAAEDRRRPTRTSARRRSSWRAGTTPRTPTRRRPPTSTRSGATSSSSPSATSCPRSCGSRASA